MDVYVAPYLGQYIVYRPLKRLAFVANAALVNMIAELQNDTARSETVGSSDAMHFLETVGFFEPDPPAPTQLLSAAPFKPTVAVCLLTTACNFRCVYCYASAGEQSSKALPVDLGRHAIDIVCRNASEAGQTQFSLSFHGGGEPTLAQRTLQTLVTYARSKELPSKISIASNGYWGRRQRAWILDHLDEVSLSFDGSQQLQDRQRRLSSGKSSFPIVMETIREMERRKFQYGIRVTVTDDGIDELAGAIEFLCEETECGTFQVEPAFDHGRARSNDLALGDNERFAAAFMQAYDTATSYCRHLYYSGARPWVVTDRFCQAVDRALIVAPGGALSACYEVYGPEHPLASEFFYGVLERGGGIKLEAETRERLQRKIAERRSLCQGCICYWHCAGDCPPKSIAAGEDGHRRFGERCDLNRMITKELLIRRIAAGNGVWRGKEREELQSFEVRA